MFSINPDDVRPLVSRTFSRAEIADGEGQMPNMNDYRVLRRHDGDRMYEEGETRTAEANVVGHLIPNVLELIGPAKAADEPEAKAEPAPSNKAEGAAPANKAIKHKGK